MFLGIYTRLQALYNYEVSLSVHLTLSDNTLTLSKKTHTHEADIAAPERQEVLVSLKRKAADQPISATQNLISEALVETSPAVNQILPNIMSLARVIQRSRAVASGSSQHQEATTSEDFTLPPTCTSTRRDEPLIVLYDGSTDRGVRVIIFATSQNHSGSGVPSNLEHG